MKIPVETEVTYSSSLLSGIMEAGLVVQFLLLVLIVMSIVSWAIIFKKRKLFAKIKNNNNQFLKFFWSVNSFEQVKNKLNQQGGGASPLSRIFDAGFLELERVKRKNNPYLGSGIDNLERSLRRQQDREISFLEEKMNFLATAGSTAPFIGLLGTVIGIMNSFRAISTTGSASLATVAPGISEALFATAIGLFVAIPAVMAYNHLLNEIRKQENSMNHFISELLNITRLRQNRD